MGKRSINEILRTRLLHEKEDRMAVFSIHEYESLRGALREARAVLKEIDDFDLVAHPPMAERLRAMLKKWGEE